METYRVVKRVASGGKLSLNDLPFRAGDSVEVVVRGQKRGPSTSDRYPLRGKPVRYLLPFESVDKNQWEVLH
jgi:hypothetical protein